ncbi:hypothetical protein JKA74_15155 [Marivirga sp. S37H4]|uniref:Uncharacterized protein n=1 Tax=Marivirga aurantiaca TaxID=2802615 RepID=A0A935C9U7_9BACT|nr:hypothetical protein [Marivirga aurantiaca]MBK6266381.1 hypothetical protein [Marivirga aurantiaca]
MAKKYIYILLFLLNTQSLWAQITGPSSVCPGTAYTYELSGATLMDQLSWNRDTIGLSSNNTNGSYLLITNKTKILLNYNQ